MAIRSGRPGVSFSGPDVMIGTVALPVTGGGGMKRAVLDEVQTY
jgi:hypothetical protein